MSSDLLFSVLPREGKVPIAHDSQKVMRIDKQESLRALSDEEKELKGEETEVRQKQQSNQNKQNKQNKENKENKEKQSPAPDQIDGEDAGTKTKTPRGPKHLDIYV